jgi:hypothetical protein
MLTAIIKSQDVMGGGLSVWLFPWRPNRRVLIGALLLAAFSMLVAGIAGLAGPGILREIVRGLFALFVVAMLVRSINQRGGTL